MKLMKKFSWVVVVVALVTGCKEDKFQPSSEERCKIGRYIYGKQGGKDVSYEIRYKLNSFTQLDLITDQVLTGDTWAAQKTYKHIYRNDSLIIKDFFQFREGATLYTALITKKVTELITTEVKNFTNGAVYRYRFDNSKEKQLTVTLEKLDGDIATYDSRAVYYFDENGDVSRQEIFRSQAIHGGEPGFVAYQDKSFTYDFITNPLKNLVIPHFKELVLPDVTFFSAHNRLTEKTADNTLTYTFVYGTDPMPSSVTTPDGTVQKFEYPNCTN
jgi:hypothetical protein